MSHSTKKLSFSIPIGANPEEQADPKVWMELLKLYNSVHNVAHTLDRYTGNSPVTVEEREQYGPSATLLSQNMSKAFLITDVDLLAGEYVTISAGTGNLVKANASAVSTLARGICLQDTAANDYAPVQFGPGLVTSFSGLSVNSRYFLSNTPGAMGTAAGTNSQILGFAISSTLFWFQPLSY